MEATEYIVPDQYRNTMRSYLYDVLKWKRPIEQEVDSGVSGEIMIVSDYVLSCGLGTNPCKHCHSLVTIKHITPKGMLSKPHHPYWDENDFEITATYCILPKAILPPGHEAEEICFDCLLEETKSKGIWVEQ